MSLNDELAAIFAHMADLMVILGADPFRVKAYTRAARAIENATEDLAHGKDDVKALSAMAGVGKGSAEKIMEYIQTGQIQAHLELLAQLPKELPALMEIQGLGPKTISLFWKQGGICSLADLTEKLKTDELTQLPGVGKKKLENLRKSISFLAKSTGRTRIGRAMPLAYWFIEQLKKMPRVQRIEYAGSLRRGKETIGDLDLLVAADLQDAAAISEKFISLEIVTDVLVHGQTKSSVRTTEGMQVDLRIVTPTQFGAALMYFTGSKEHNVAMRQRANRLGMSLNEYALTRDGEPVASETEQAVFAAMGLSWIAPPLRENLGELILAEDNKLPKLIELADIKAELHAHTTASDGSWRIRQYAAFALARGYHTIAVTDHSKSQAQANGLSESRLEQHIIDIREVAKEFENSLRILAGSEVDILADGSLDYPDSLLKELDIVVASPHAALSQEPAKATARLLKAIEHPYVTILGHPTGRLVNRREGLSPDMNALFKAAANRGIAMEINAHHMRLDLRDRHARAALDAGVKLAIDTDAHQAGNMDELIYGVLTAQRAGAQSCDVVNCLNRDDLAAWLTSTRA